MSLKQNIKTFFCATLSALLCFVIVFNLSFNAFHIQNEKHHHASEQTCSPDEENDACHRYLIHNEKSISCNGEHEHISTKTDECFVCTYYKNQQTFLATGPSFHFIPQIFTGGYFLQDSKLKTSLYPTVFSRGPPALG